MKFEHKVVSAVEPDDLERRLNELGEEGWSAAAATPSRDRGYLVVLTRSQTGEHDDVQLVQLAMVHKVRQTVMQLVGWASKALPLPEARRGIERERPSIAGGAPPINDKLSATTRTGTRRDARLRRTT